jgi:phosphoribosylaminoimidazolecarboxamide formyltransferase / IMP cyclohydrolase
VRALLSVYDKTGLAELGRGLAKLGVALVSTGSTARVLREAGVEVTEVADVTGFPEIMDGRVKTLHPAIHAGILADRAKGAHMATLDEHGIAPIDLVIANLYPFASDPSIELIDIGGPAMVRAAAKNHASVGVVVDPADYDDVLAELSAGGELSADTRRRLAGKAFAHTADYDATVADWFGRGTTLRYGENPHQQARFVSQGWGLGAARQLHGKALSYNNLLDADAAWGMAADFPDPTVVIVKHNNPAGLASAADLASAYPAALAGDPDSAFGGIVAVNRALDAATAQQVVGVFTEVVCAPAVEPAALEVLATKANLRVLVVDVPSPPGTPRSVRSVAGGLLVQDADTAPEDEGAWTVPTQAQPSDAVLEELRFAWRVAKHTKSNAIVLTRDRAAVGVGAGQMSRVDSVRLALEKSRGRAAGAVLASDAFFPFRDGPDTALAAGVVALIQPGGSVRDAEVVAACDERGVPMVFTGRRHFRH